MSNQANFKVGDRVRIIRGDYKGWTAIIKSLNNERGDIEAILDVENYYNYEKVTGHSLEIAGYPVEWLEIAKSDENHREPNTEVKSP